MTTLKAGEAVPAKVAAAAERAWWRYKYHHPVSAEDPHLAFVFAWKRCTTNMLMDQFGLMGMLDKLEETNALLRELTIERETELLGEPYVDLETGEVVDEAAG